MVSKMMIAEACDGDRQTVTKEMGKEPFNPTLETMEMLYAIVQVSE